MVQVLNWLNCHIGTGHRLRELPRFRSSIDRTAILYRIWIERTAKVQVLNWQNCHIGTGHQLRELPRFRSLVDTTAKLVQATDQVFQHMGKLFNPAWDICWILWNDNFFNCTDIFDSPQPVQRETGQFFHMIATYVRIIYKICPKMPKMAKNRSTRNFENQ